MKVVYKNGRLYEWTQVDNGYFTLNGCDILFNFSGYSEEVGTHTIFVHYMGYYAEARYTIVDCIHKYEAETAFVSPSWLEQGEIQNICTKCGGGGLVEGYTPSGYELSREFMSRLNSAEGDEAYSSYSDFDNNGIINMRDYKYLMDMYAAALDGMFLHLNEKEGDSSFTECYDINDDGVINIRDYSLLLQSYNLY